MQLIHPVGKELIERRFELRRCRWSSVLRLLLRLRPTASSACHQRQNANKRRSDAEHGHCHHIAIFAASQYTSILRTERGKHRSVVERRAGVGLSFAPRKFGGRRRAATL